MSMWGMLIVAAAVFWFAISNTQEVTVRLFFWHVTAPLAITIGITFILGFFVGFVQLMPGFWRHRSKAKKSTKALGALEKERDDLKKHATTLEDKVRQLSSQENSPSE